MRYILNDRYTLCGYRGLPFALYDTWNGETFFFTRNEYSLLLDCDGSSEISIGDLNEEDQKTFRSLINGGLIRISGEEHLKPHQEYRFYDVYYKENVQFSITGRCNYKCRHCFMSAPHARYDEMSLADCIKVLEQLKDCGIRNVQITGGEPLTHPAFKRIVEEIKKSGLNLQILYTNGLLLKQDIFDLLKNNVQHPKIQISFDGLGHHDWLRGVNNAQKYAADAIRLCVENGFECETAMVLYKDNLDSIGETVRYLDSLGVSTVRISNIFDQGEWLAYSAEHGISIEDVYEKFLEYIPQYFEDDLKTDISLGGFFGYSAAGSKVYSAFENNCNKDTEQKHYLCRSLKRALYIASNGLVLPCASMISTKVEENALNILDHDLKDIINDSCLSETGNLKARDFLENNSKCNTCQYKYQCLGGCRARALVDKGSIFETDEDVCTYYTGGYKERKDELLKKLKKI